MSIAASRLPCYLAEWYLPDLTDDLLERAVTRVTECIASMRDESPPVRLLVALAVPVDDWVFGVFTADSPELVARVCSQAGIPAQRVSPAIEARQPWENT